jgi:hypothetical protein
VENNFNCCTCHAVFLIPRYSFQVTRSTNVYIDGSIKKPVTCPVCGSAAVEVIKKPIDLTGVLYGRFSSASDEDKKVMLRKRAKQHMKKDAEQRHEIETKFRGRVNTSHY